MALKEEKMTDWLSLSPVLQQQFFENAAKQAKQCKKNLEERVGLLEEYRKHIEKRPVPKSGEWKKWRVAVIDGSNSPSTSERLGIRLGTFCAVYLIFEGDRQVEEGYHSDSLLQNQTGSQEVSQKLLTMLRTRLEREVALHCLKKDVDLILIDGSFFGFRADAHFLKDEVLDFGRFATGKDLIEDLRDKTLELMKSKKAVGVIKRTRTNAIDGWLLRNYGDDSFCVNTNDKHILSYLLKPGEWFSYAELFKKPPVKNPDKAFHYYSRLKETYRYVVLREKRKVSMDALYEKAQRNVEHNVFTALGYTSELILNSSRYFVRCSNAAPFEFETKYGTEVEPLLSYFQAFHNPATGLPWPIDLVDSSASLPRGFNREFAEEVEALLIRDPEVNKLALQESFSYLNPQKEED